MIEWNGLIRVSSEANLVNKIIPNIDLVCSKHFADPSVVDADDRDEEGNNVEFYTNLYSRKFNRKEQRLLTYNPGQCPKMHPILCTGLPKIHLNMKKHFLNSQFS